MKWLSKKIEIEVKEIPEDCRTIEEYNRETKCRCSEITERMQFCASISQIALESGNKIVVNTLLKNVSDKAIKISMVGDFNTFYDVNIKDASGNKILSNEEVLAEKIKNNM